MRISKFFLLICCLWTSWGYGEEKQDSVWVVENRPFLDFITWPLEHLIEPAVELVAEPIKPPIDYIFEEKLVRKSVRLITFGKRQNILTNPVLSITGGDATFVGFVYRHSRIKSDEHNDHFNLMAKLFIDKDWEINSRYKYRNAFFDKTNLSFSYKVVHHRLLKVDLPTLDTVEIYNDSSFQIGTGVSYSPLKNIDIGIGYQFKKYNLTNPSNDFNGDALAIGLGKKFTQSDLSFELSYNTTESRFTPTTGKLYRLSFTRGKAPGMNHYVIDQVFRTYFLLGKKVYRLSKQERSKNKRFLRKFSVVKFVSLFSLKNYQNTLFEKKVLLIQFRSRHLFDRDNDLAPFAAYSKIGTSTPLRGYPSDQLDYDMASVSFEYRWPIIKLVDGSVFNEYALLGNRDHVPRLGTFRNSWGFGVRIRKSNLFLTRFQVGFRGFSGVNVVLTISPAYR